MALRFRKATCDRNDSFRIRERKRNDSSSGAQSTSSTNLSFSLLRIRTKHLVQSSQRRDLRLPTRPASSFHVTFRISRRLEEAMSDLEVERKERKRDASKWKNVADARFFVGEDVEGPSSTGNERTMETLRRRKRAQSC